MIAARKEVERHSDTIVRIAKEKEILTHDKAELSVQLTAAERECRQQSEVHLKISTLFQQAYYNESDIEKLNINIKSKYWPTSKRYFYYCIGKLNRRVKMKDLLASVIF